MLGAALPAAGEAVAPVPDDGSAVGVSPGDGAGAGFADVLGEVLGVGVVLSCPGVLVGVGVVCTDGVGVEVGVGVDVGVGGVGVGDGVRVGNSFSGMTIRPVLLAGSGRTTKYTTSVTMKMPSSAIVVQRGWWMSRSHFIRTPRPS